MFLVVVMILLNGLCHLSFGYIRAYDVNQTTWGADKSDCQRIPVYNCFICSKLKNQWTLDKNANVILCYTGHWKGRMITVADILSEVPENTTQLEVGLDNVWQGMLPFQPPPIDLTPIIRLKELVYFNLYHRKEKYVQLYPLHFTKETFAGMTKLRLIALNIPMKDQSLQDLLSPLDSLQYLYLQPHAISMKNMSDTIANLHPNTDYTLETLHLSNFQLLGMDGYNSTLNMTSFLSNRIFRHVKKLYLKGNSLAQLMPGILIHFPNIEYIDISYNLLIDTANAYTLFEIVTHKTIIKLNFQHQGYVGGSQISADTHFPQPYDTYKDTLDKSKNTSFVNHAFVVKCINEQDRINGTANISNLVLYKTMRNKVFESIVGRPFNSLIDHLTPLEDYYDANCLFFFKIPIGPRVKEIGYSNVHLEESTFKGLQFSGNLCIKKPNNLRMIDTLCLEIKAGCPCPNLKKH